MATRKIADYAIVREHARGGMGTVFQALSPEGATVAVKTVLLPENADPRARWEAIERFQREARAASSLSHPNICQVLDFGADEDSLYMVMEFLEGNTVRDLIGDAGAIKVDRAVEIVCSVGEALAHAHDQGIVHRDVKPENIMILRGGQAKLTDFGLASVASQQTMTMPGTTMGTMFYMSPEQVRGEKVDARSDIFSLGATFYEMLTGVRAFQAEEPAGVVNQILNTDPPPIAGVPANVSEAVERCLRKDPEERYQSTREIIASLKAGATDAAPSAITAVPTPRPEAARGGRGLPRVFRLWPVLAAVAAVLAVGALLLFRPWTRLGGEPTTIDVAGEAPSTTAEGVPARPEPPPPLDTPEAEEADVRRRATFHYPEDFEGGLEWFDVGPTGSGVTTVEDDALVLAADPSPVPGAAYPHWSDFRGAVMPCEFVIEARMTKLEGPDDAQFGFAFHAALVDAYVFALCGNGDVWIVKEVGGRFTELARVERAPQVNRGNAENVLKAVRRHGQLHIFINDQHVLTAEDFDLGTMMLCLVVTSGVRAAFSDILVQGISMRGIFYDIDRHMARLETREAREKLDYLRLYAPNLAAPGIERALESIDRRTTVMVIIPPGARLRRGGDAPAKRLVDTINAKGEDRPSHFALDVTETEVESKEAYLECPLIAIGHPDWTAMTERLRTELPRDREVSTDEILIYHDIGIPGGEGRVALWGQNTKTDMDAVELFIDKLLDEYLKMIWEEQ